MEVGDVQQTLGSAVFGDGKVQQQQSNADDAAALEQKQAEEAAAAAQQQSQQVDVNAVLKEKLGYEDWDAAANEIKSLKELKDNPLSAHKWENETSKTMFDLIKEGKEDELFEVLKTKKEFEAVDSLTAEQVIKLNIKHSNKHFKDADVNDVFEEQYRLPKQPVQKEDEEDTDFSVRENEWKEATERVSRKIERDAFTAKDNILKQKEKIVFPTITKEGEKSAEQIQRELDATADYDKFFINEVETNFKNFKGFTTSFKDGDVEFPIVVNVTEDEVGQLKKDVLEDAKNQFIFNRWFDKDGKPNVEVMESDMYLLKNRESILSKVASDSVSAFKDHFIKTKKNITDFNGSGGQQQNAGSVDLMQELGTAVFY